MEKKLLDDILESQDFFDILQCYRIADPGNQERVIKNFESVKSFIRANFVPKYPYAALSELSLSDLSSLMTYYSREMSKLQERNAMNTIVWEDFAWKKHCVMQEYQSRLSKIEFPKP